MKTLLIYPPSLSVYGLPRHPTMGITYLATVLYEKGLPVEVLDMRFPQYNLQFLKQRLIAFQPEVVGVGSTSFDFPAAQQVFRAVKRFSPKIATILGGPHASVSPQEALMDKNIDHLFIGEGEEELPKLVRTIKQERKRTIIAKSINGLDRLPFPKWDLFPLADYKVRGKLKLPLMTSRGCPFSCIYCVSWKTHGKRFRARSPQNVVDEIENDISAYGVESVSFLDDNFTLQPERALKICQEIIKRNLKINWTCDQGIRADQTNKKLFQAMKQSGCQLVALGVESADQQVLNEMKKGEQIETIRQAIIEAKEAGLIVKTFFIVGGPGDNLEKTQKAIEFFKEAKVDIPRFGMMTAYPGSELWGWVLKNGRFLGNPYRHILQSPTTANKVQFETKDFSKKERLAAFKIAEKEAEIWAIRQWLVKQLGPFLAKIVVLPFYPTFVRELVKKIYRLRIFSITD